MVGDGPDTTRERLFLILAAEPRQDRWRASLAPKDGGCELDPVPPCRRIRRRGLLCGGRPSTGASPPLQPLSNNKILRPSSTASACEKSSSIMVASGLILALAGMAAAADLSGFSVMRNPVAANGLGVNLALNDGCEIGEKSCDSNYCIPLTGSCCSVGNGAYCKVGKYCVTGGCCQIGKVCTGGGSGSCDTGEKSCGQFCIPSSGQCCQTSTGRWCESGTTCAQGGTKCAVGGGGGNGSPSSSDSVGGRTTSDILGGGATSSDSTGNDATTSYSLGPATTSDAGSTPTTDSSGGSSATAGSNDSSSSSSSSSSATSSASQTAATRPPPPNAGPTNAPNLLVGLLAAAPLVVL